MILTNRKTVSLYLAGAFALFSSSALATVEARVVLMPGADAAKTMVESLESVGLSNCKQLVESALDVVVVRIECNTAEDMKPAVADLLPADGMDRATIWFEPAQE